MPHDTTLHAHHTTFVCDVRGMERSVACLGGNERTGAAVRGDVLLTAFEWKIHAARVGNADNVAIGWLMMANRAAVEVAGDWM
jgi:hypothetical protein